MWVIRYLIISAHCLAICIEILIYIYMYSARYSYLTRTRAEIAPGTCFLTYCLCFSTLDVCCRTNLPHRLACAVCLDPKTRREKKHALEHLLSPRPRLPKSSLQTVPGLLLSPVPNLHVKLRNNAKTKLVPSTQRSRIKRKAIKGRAGMGNCNGQST